MDNRDLVGQLAAQFAKIIDSETFKDGDNFFLSGGDSLSVLQFADSIQQEQLPDELIENIAEAIYANPDPESLAHWIAENLSKKQG